MKNVRMGDEMIMVKKQCFLCCLLLLLLTNLLNIMFSSAERESQVEVKSQRKNYTFSR